VFEGVGQKREMASPLDRGANQTLVLLARAGLPARLDLAAIADVNPETADLFIVDAGDVIGTEPADLAPPGEAPRGASGTIVSAR
jgi:hypothetical protein